MKTHTKSYCLCIKILLLIGPLLILLNGVVSVTNQETKFASLEGHNTTGEVLLNKNQENYCTRNTDVVGQYENVGIRVAKVLVNLKVKSYALLTQCGYDPIVREVISSSNEAGISSCTFTTQELMSRIIMVQPDYAYCFSDSEWTFVLFGLPFWSLQIINGSRQLYSERSHWIFVVSANSNLDEIEEFNSMLAFTDRVTLLKWSSQLQDWVAQTYTPLADGLKFQSTRISSSLQLQPSAVLKPTRPLNFFKRKLYVIGRHPTGPIGATQKVAGCYFQNGQTRCTGYVGKLVDVIAASLNLTLENRSVKSCGIAGRNGTRVDEIGKNRADLALGTCSITYNRLQVVAFTEWFNAVRSTIISKSPKPIQDEFILFNIFSRETWGAILIYILIVTLSTWTVSKILMKKMNSKTADILSSFALVIKITVYQSHKIQPESLAGRIVMAVSWLGMITLFGIYQGNLTAWLSLPRYAKPVDTLQDLRERPELVPFVYQYDPNHMMFINHSSGLFGEINERLQWADRANLFFEKVVHKEAVYMNSDRSAIRKATEQNVLDGIEGMAPCRVYFGRTDLRQDYLGLMINKNSRFKEQLNQRIQRLRSFGIVTKLFKEFNPPTCLIRNEKGSRTSVNRLSFTEVQGLFMVWLVGISFSSFVFVWELIIKKCSNYPLHVSSIQWTKSPVQSLKLGIVPGTNLPVAWSQPS